MYRGFELDIKDWDISEYHEQGLLVFNSFKPKVKTVLDTYLKENKALDGDKMRDEWFPLVHADIFISHSHADKVLAICLAGWLYKNFKIKAFIDSMIWGYADELLKEIDKKYCMDSKKENYLYKPLKDSSSHINIMLATALTKMIDKSECFFFIKTTNSITTERAIKQAGTYSPWIYSEIELSRLVRKQPLKAYRRLTLAEIKTFSVENQKFLNESLKMEHPLNTEHLETISEDELMLWDLQYTLDKCRFPLDLLYMNHPLPETKLL